MVLLCAVTVGVIRCQVVLVSDSNFEEGSLSQPQCEDQARGGSVRTPAAPALSGCAQDYQLHTLYQE